MAKINPYLNFNGRCKDAMTFYQQCFGGELTLQKVSESPMGAKLSSQAGATILHSQLISNDIVLMGSDMIGAELVTGNAVTLCLQCEDDEVVHTTFDKLAQGGHVKTPVHQTFWGATYGEVIDRYGIMWMLNHSKNS